jgi:hypothetical protein
VERDGREQPFESDRLSIPLRCLRRTLSLRALRESQCSHFGGKLTMTFISTSTGSAFTIVGSNLHRLTASIAA